MQYHILETIYSRPEFSVKKDLYGIDYDAELDLSARCPGAIECMVNSRLSFRIFEGVWAPLKGLGG